MKTDESEQKDKRARVRETGEESVVFGDNQRQREGRWSYCEFVYVKEKGTTYVWSCVLVCERSVRQREGREVFDKRLLL